VSRPFYGTALQFTSNHVHDGPPSRQGLRECRGCTRGQLLGAGGRAVVSSFYSVMWQKRSFGVRLGGGDARALLAAARGKGVH